MNLVESLKRTCEERKAKLEADLPCVRVARNIRDHNQLSKARLQGRWASAMATEGESLTALDVYNKCAACDVALRRTAPHLRRY